MVAPSLALCGLSLFLCLLGRIVDALRSPVTKIDFFATTVRGLEKVLSDEIKALPGSSRVTIGSSSVSFKGTIETGVEALMWLRTPLKLMEKIAECDCVASKDVLFDWISSIEWSHIISPDHTLKCDTVLGQNNPSDLRHSHFTSLTIKNAIIDQFRSRKEFAGARPSVDIVDPDLPLLLYLHRAEGTLYRVWSGEGSMHKRRYRSASIHKAALRESTAAGLLLSTDWLNAWHSLSSEPIDNNQIPGPVSLCDPMCGSGTFAIEAALMAADTAPGLLRYAAEATPIIDTRMNMNTGSQDSADATTSSATSATISSTVPCPLRWIDMYAASTPIWDEAWEVAKRRDQRGRMNSVNNDPVVLVNDANPASIKLAIAGAGNAGVHRMIEFSCKDVADYCPTRRPSVIVTNPPWDRRLDGADDAWRKLNCFLERLQNNNDEDSREEEEEECLGDGSKNSDKSPIALSELQVWTLTGNEEITQQLTAMHSTQRLPVRAASVNMAFYQWKFQDLMGN